MIYSASCHLSALALYNSFMRQPFEITDHTADIGMIVHGKTPEQVFSNAGQGLFSLITDLDKIEPAITKNIDLYAHDMEELLITWLNELIYVFETEHLLLKQFKIEELTDHSLRAACDGQKINKKTEIYREIKAATYHMLSIENHAAGLTANIIFDL
jgi:SHS2 domain-containing protein